MYVLSINNGAVKPISGIERVYVSTGSVQILLQCLHTPASPLYSHAVSIYMYMYVIDVRDYLICIHTHHMCAFVRIRNGIIICQLLLNSSRN